ncbi:sugar phosphate isomerase/epimerase family protein [Wenyingzhuangia sp. IMCC45574]
MRTLFHLAITSFFSVLLFACTNKKNNPSIKIREVSPWCIIGFDSLNRTPKQRISMLKQMGFTKYGYNKGKGDLSKMKDEFRLAKENNLQITSVFLWLNANRDSIGKLSSMNQELLNNLTEIDTKPTIWLSFSHNFFKNINQNESIEVATKMIKQIKLKADEIGCKLALYNHHGWFGNPYNQLEVLEKLNQDDISIVYNFHHAHEYVDEFPKIVKKIMPYLSYVNLNGVKKEGPKILPIGKGDFELKMIQQLLEEGYKGPWGILGHIKNEDVQKVLNRNIDGLKLINSKLNQHQ